MFGVIIILTFFYQTLCGCQAASFLPVKAANGSAVCAVGNVSYAIQTDDILGIPNGAPGATKCGFFCTGLNSKVNSNCTGFNFLIAGLCQFFNDPCVPVAWIPGCSHYKVSVVLYETTSS
jgi:hypothetical protein